MKPTVDKRYPTLQSVLGTTLYESIISMARVTLARTEEFLILFENRLSELDQRGLLKVRKVRAKLKAETQQETKEKAFDYLLAELQATHLFLDHAAGNRDLSKDIVGFEGIEGIVNPTGEGGKRISTRYQLIPEVFKKHNKLGGIVYRDNWPIPGRRPRSALYPNPLLDEISPYTLSSDLRRKIVNLLA